MNFRCLSSGIVFGFLFLAGAGCASSNHVWEGDKTQALVLAPENASCELEYEKRIWYVLFGAYPINSFDEGFYFKKPGAAYRLTDGMHTSDLLITILGGWLVSLTTRTYTVEVCKSEFVLQSPAEREASINKELQRYGQQGSEPLIVYVDDGRSFKGRLKEIDSDYWHLETSAPEDEDEEEDKEVSEENSQTPEERPDVLELKNGQTLTGKVLAQSRYSIRFRTRAGTRRYLKSSIQRLRYRVDINEDVKKVIKIRRNQITRVLFQGN